VCLFPSGRREGGGGRECFLVFVSMVLRVGERMEAEGGGFFSFFTK